MQLFKSIPVLMTLACSSFLANASLPTGEVSTEMMGEVENIFGSTQSQSDSSGLMREQSYKLGHSSVVRVLETADTNPGKVQAGNYLQFPKDAEITVLDIKQDPTYGSIVRIGIDVYANEEMPSDMWVPAADLLKGNLDLVNLDAFDLSDDQNDQIAQNDDDYYEVDEARRKGGKRKGKKGRGGRRKGGMTYCFRIVKKALVAKGICDRYPSGAYASQGYSVLQRECGMRPVKYSASLPVGAVCVSAGKRMCGKSRCGHIAVKTAGGWTVTGGSKSDNPFVGKPKGCLTP